MQGRERIVLLAAGECDPVQAQIEARKASRVIAVDAGWDVARSVDLRVDLVVGDLDSVSPEGVAALRSSSIPTLEYPREKDASDLELALDWALAQRPFEIVILGALGGRVDHALANIHLLERGAAAGVDVRLESKTEAIRLIRDRFDLVDARHGDVVSLLPISEAARVTTQGLRYALADQLLYRASSRGVSNVVDSLPVTLTISSGLVVAIHQRGTR
ncbi:MAG: thiamine diphosphokinase [Candidatus Bipolaricaulota bacterium]